MKAKVLVVDDHPIVRQGLVQFINQQADLVVCWEGEEPAKAFEAVGSVKPNILVVDISLKSGSGLELIKNVKATYPHLPTLVLSMHDELLYAERALRAGARGYIMKQEAIDKVLVAIRRVLAGELFLSEQMNRRMLHQFVGGPPQLPQSPVERLSDRELEVFRLIGSGRTTRQMADELHLSVKTVETHRAHIMDKMKIATANELALRAFQWVHDEDAG
jgi:DNA-binding NarL/FixJ family response regulator